MSAQIIMALIFYNGQFYAQRGVDRTTRLLPFLYLPIRLFGFILLRL